MNPHGHSLCDNIAIHEQSSPRRFPRQASRRSPALRAEWRFWREPTVMEIKSHLLRRIAELESALRRTAELEAAERNQAP